MSKKLVKKAIEMIRALSEEDGEEFDVEKEEGEEEKEEEQQQ